MQEYGYDENNRLLINFLVRSGKKCFASNAEANGLFEILDDNTANFIKTFPNESMYKYFLFSDCICSGDYLVFVPGAADHIHIYDVRTQHFHIVNFKLDVEHNGYLETYKFICAKETDDFIYFLPNTYPAIIRMKKKTWEISYIDDWLPREQFRFRRGYVDCGAVIYTVSQNSNMLFMFDYTVEKVRVIQYDDEVIGGMGLCVSENYAWIAAASNEACVIKVDLRDGAVVEKRVYSKEYGRYEYAFAYVFSRDEYKYFCPKGIKKMLILGPAEDAWKEIPYLTNLRQDLFLMHKSNDELLFYRKNAKDKYGIQSERCAVIFNEKTMEVQECVFTLNNWQEYKQVLLTDVNESIVFYENSLLGLNEIGKLIHERAEMSNEENCGEKIFKALINLEKNGD